MFMGSFMFICAGFLYWLLKPPVPKSNSILQEEIEFSGDPSQNCEVMAGCYPDPINSRFSFLMAAQIATYKELRITLKWNRDLRGGTMLIIA